MTPEEFRARCDAELGKPYTWGGDGPDSYDCSGLTLTLLRWLQIAPTHARTADEQFRYFERSAHGQPVTKAVADLGDLIFYGPNEGATHVTMAWGSGDMIECAPGDRSVKTEQEARRRHAEVRIRPISRRTDLLEVIRPIGLPWTAPVPPPGDPDVERQPLVPEGRLWSIVHDTFALRPAYSYDDLRAEYERLWASIQIRPEHQHEVTADAARIQANQVRYQALSAVTGVPWHVIGLIHFKEAGLRFDRHLHNGDPLTARTVQVPRGRPSNGHPPFTWEESATDALTFDGMTANHDWSASSLAYHMERFNGFGYRRLPSPINTPYLWSYTTHYDRGLYVHDGVYGPDAIARNSGVMALLRAMIDSGTVEG